MANNIASLERSLQNFSLHDEGSTTTTTTTLGGATADSPPENPTEEEEEDKPIELNSHVSLPYEWEQCLDLKTGEIYYINMMNGMKVKEDPRLFGGSEYYYNNYREEVDDEEEEDSLVLYDDSDESSSESSSASSPLPPDQNVVYNNEDNVLVVAGCKSCLMYFMLPKQVEECPKCSFSSSFSLFSFNLSLNHHIPSSQLTKSGINSSSPSLKTRERKTTYYHVH